MAILLAILLTILCSLDICLHVASVYIFYFIYKVGISRIKNVFFINLSISEIFISALIVCEEVLDMMEGVESTDGISVAGPSSREVKLHISLYVAFLSHFLHMLLITADRVANHVYHLPQHHRHASDDTAKLCVAISWTTEGGLLLFLLLYWETENRFNYYQVFTDYVLPIVGGLYLLFCVATSAYTRSNGQKRSAPHRRRTTRTSAILHHYGRSSVCISALLRNSFIVCVVLPTLVLLMVKQTLLSEASAMDINKFFYAVDFLVDAVIRILVDPVTRKITLWKFCGTQSPPSSKKYSL